MPYIHTCIYIYNEQSYAGGGGTCVLSRAHISYNFMACAPSHLSFINYLLIFTNSDESEESDDENYHDNLARAKVIAREIISQTTRDISDWANFGLNLNITRRELKKILVKHSSIENIQHILIEVIKVWLRTNREANWQGLTTAFLKMGSKRFSQALISHMKGRYLL